MRRSNSGAPAQTPRAASQISGLPARTRQIAREHEFRERSGVFDNIRARNRPALAGLDPLTVRVRALDTAVGLLRAVLEIVHPLLGQELGRFGVVSGREEDALVAVVERTATGQRAVAVLAGHRRLHAAVEPRHGAGNQISALRELVADNRPPRRADLVFSGGFSGDAEVAAEVQRPERSIHQVAAHVAKGATAVVPPGAPGEGYESLVVPTGRGDALPEIPVERFRHGLDLGGRSTPCGQIGRFVHM